MSSTPRKPQDRVASLTVRCRPEFRQWLEELALAQRLTVSQLVEHAFVVLAAALQHPAPPRR